MRNVKLILSYDGTNFSGYQSQVDQRTVEDELKKALNKINDCKTKVYCAGRTDTGVHAEMQVVNFFTERERMSEFNWIMALNSSLPMDIRITGCDFVDSSFNARRSAVKREYWYHLINAPFISALRLRYASHYPAKNLDLMRLQEYAVPFIGEHDFTSFCSSRDICESKVRYIESFVVEKFEDEIIFKITGNAFLHHMVRTIVGTILMVFEKNESPEKIKEIIDSKNRHNAGPTYFPRGLVLKKVYY